MDSPRKFINLNTPIINLIKFLTIATSFILAAPVFADTSQKLACYIAIDYDTAFHTCTKAAKQGKAQYELGFMYYNGQGTPKNNVLAYVWWNITAAQGHESAASNTSNRGNLEGLMTPNQIAEAQKSSKEYYAKYVK
jgi:TPR repeat protein